MPAWRRFLGQFADPLIYLLLAATAISLVAWVLEGHDGAPYDAIVIMGILVANAVLGYVQEARAERRAALQRMAAATASVLRGGREDRVPASEVVPGDVLLLAEGDAVAADGRLVEAASLTVAEASLTGESVPVLKNRPGGRVGQSRRPREHGLRRYRGRARSGARRRDGNRDVDGDGQGRPAARSTAEQHTPLQREVDRIGRMLGIAVIVIALVVVGTTLLTSDIGGASDVVAVLLVGVALAVAAVPEGLPAVLSVVLARGVQRMAGKHAIVKKLSSVETLGSASVICSDKTGTLTKNEMTIQKVVTGSGEVDITGSGYLPEGELRVDDGGCSTTRSCWTRSSACSRPGAWRTTRSCARTAASGRSRATRPTRRFSLPRRRLRASQRVGARGSSGRRDPVLLRAEADDHAAPRCQAGGRCRGHHQGCARSAARALHRRACLRPRSAADGNSQTRDLPGR